MLREGSPSPEKTVSFGVEPTASGASFLGGEPEREGGNFSFQVPAKGPEKKGEASGGFPRAPG